MSPAVLNCPDHFVSTLSTQAYGKINLILEVKGRRPDGFHEIRSLAIGVSLADRVTCRLVPGHEVQISCSISELAREDNLACRAAQAFLQHSGIPAGVEIELEKHIPVGGGMGGGSSNAAAVLCLLNEMTGAGLSRKRLSELGAGLGSDVPLFFHLPCATLQGRGERVESTRFRWKGFVLLVMVEAVVSTPLVYGKWSAERSIIANRQEVPSRLGVLRTADELNELLFNDLEKAVCDVSATVKETCQALQRLGVGSFRISGAGSTLFRLYDEEADARRIARQIETHVNNLRTRIVAAPAGGYVLNSEEC